MLLLNEAQASQAKDLLNALIKIGFVIKRQNGKQHESVARNSASASHHHMNHVTFQNLAHKYQQAEQQDQAFREQVARVVDVSQLKEFSRSKRAVVLVASSKAYAQELFLKKEMLKDALSCEVVIK